MIGSKWWLRETTSQAEHWHGRKRRPELCFFASGKNQLYDLGSNLWTSFSSSVHEIGGLNSSFQCVCWLLPRARNIFLHHAHTYTHTFTHMWQKQQFHETVLSTCNAFWYFFYSLLFHYFNNGSLDLLNGFHNPLMGHALRFEKTQNSVISKVPSSSRLQWLC